MKKFYVIGHPVSHSLSPVIHQAFAAQFDMQIAYEVRDFEPGNFIDCMARLRREENPVGVNVTVPFKEDAFAYCDEVTDRARVARAVNTILFDGSRAVGDNTDGVGFVRDVIGRCGVPLQGARVLVCGAGGAARGVIAALKPLGCAKIAVANRTHEKAVQLGIALGVDAVTYVDTAREGWEVVINATSASLLNVAPAIPNVTFKHAALAYDLMYARHPTPFMRLAAESGAARVEDGLGMLVEQAAEAFRIWLGVSPDTSPVLARLR